MKTMCFPKTLIGALSEERDQWKNSCKSWRVRVGQCISTIQFRESSNGRQKGNLKTKWLSQNAGYQKFVHKCGVQIGDTVMFSQISDGIYRAELQRRESRLLSSAVAATRSAVDSVMPESACVPTAGKGFDSSGEKSESDLSEEERPAGQRTSGLHGVEWTHDEDEQLRQMIVMGGAGDGWLVGILSVARMAVSHSFTGFRIAVTPDPK